MEYPQRWVRFASSRTYHLTRPDWIRNGKSLCNRLDLTHTGYEWCGPVSHIPKRFKVCALCARKDSK